MAPLGSSLVKLKLQQSTDSVHPRFQLCEALALAAALPGLQELELGWGGDIAGAAVVHLVSQLLQLRLLRISRSCYQAMDIVTAVATAQGQAHAGLRPNPLLIHLAWSVEDPFETRPGQVELGAKQLLASAQLGPQRVLVTSALNLEHLEWPGLGGAKCLAVVGVV